MLSNTYNEASWHADWTFEKQNECFSFHRSFFVTYDVRKHHDQVVLIYLKHEKHFQGQKQSDPIVPEQATQTISVQCPTRWFQILLNCEKRQSVSYTSNLLEQMCGYRRYIMFLQKWILNLQDLPQSQNLETVPICIVFQCYPHDNIVCIHLCDEYMKSIDSGVCHRPWSILWWIVRAYLLTIEYQVVQFLPSISISEQFESMYLTILQQILFLLLWSGGHQCME